MFLVSFTLLEGRFKKKLQDYSLHVSSCWKTTVCVLKEKQKTVMCTFCNMFKNTFCSNCSIQKIDFYHTRVKILSRFMHKSADGRNRGSIISGDFMWSGTNELEPSKFVFWVGVPRSECSKSGCVVLCIAYIVRTQLQIRFYRCFV